jgi:hypothetical protein
MPSPDFLVVTACACARLAGPVIPSLHPTLLLRPFDRIFFLFSLVFLIFLFRPPLFFLHYYKKRGVPALLTNANKAWIFQVGNLTLGVCTSALTANLVL